MQRCTRLNSSKLTRMSGPAAANHDPTSASHHTNAHLARDCIAFEADVPALETPLIAFFLDVSSPRRTKDRFACFISAFVRSSATPPYPIGPAPLFPLSPRLLSSGCDAALGCLQLAISSSDSSAALADHVRRASSHRRFCSPQTSTAPRSWSYARASGAF